jgi:prepilin-type processing-associated H-X9-DG protein
VGIFRCPSDAGDIAPDVWWGAPRISYAANGLIHWVNNANRLVGVMGMAQSWISDNTCPLAKVGRPAESIMIAEKHDPENSMWFGPRTMFYSYSVWNDAWGKGVVPDGSRPVTNAYPNGPDGGAATKHNGLNNMVFVDGHAKAMKPSATNPHPWNLPARNMWDVTRQ